MAKEKPQQVPQFTDVQKREILLLQRALLAAQVEELAAEKQLSISQDKLLKARAAFQQGITKFTSELGVATPEYSLDIDTLAISKAPEKKSA